MLKLSLCLTVSLSVSDEQEDDSVGSGGKVRDFIVCVFVREAQCTVQCVKLMWFSGKL